MEGQWVYFQLKLFQQKYSIKYKQIEGSRCNLPLKIKKSGPVFL